MAVKINAKRLQDIRLVDTQERPSPWQAIASYTKSLFEQTMSIEGGCGYCDFPFLILGGLCFFVFGLVVGIVEILVSEYYPECSSLDSGDDDELSDLETEVDTGEEDLELYLSAAEDNATSNTNVVGTCVYCSLPIRGKPLQTCIECNGLSCHGCLRTFFLLATKNEECMPPRHRMRTIVVLRLRKSRTTKTRQPTAWTTTTKQKRTSFKIPGAPFRLTVCTGGVPSSTGSSMSGCSSSVSAAGVKCFLV